MLPIVLVIGMFILLDKAIVVHIFSDKIFATGLNTDSAQKTLLSYGFFEVFFRFFRCFFFLGVVVMVWRKNKLFRDLKITVHTAPPKKSDM